VKAAEKDWDRKAAYRTLVDDLGRRYSFDRVCVRNYRHYHPAQKIVLEQLEQASTEWPEALLEGKGVILIGSVGTGKDHLCAAMLYKAVELGVKARYIAGSTLFSRMRDSFSTNVKETDVLGPYASAQVLAISDPIPAVGDLTEWNSGVLFRLVDDRYREMKSTWITINAASRDDAEQRLSAPVFDRLRHDALILHCFWPSYRELRKS
jgi:DNA replication protein DnaC